MDDDTDGLQELFGPAENALEPAKQEKSRWRRFIGKPRIWVSAFWCVIGIAWLVVSAFEPAAWRIVFGAIYLVIALIQLTVAVSDRRNRRGHYAHRPQSAR